MMGRIESKSRAHGMGSYVWQTVFAIAAAVAVGCEPAADKTATSPLTATAASNADLLATRLSAVLPAIEVDGDRCRLRFGSRFLDFVGITTQGEPICFAADVSIALGPDILLRQDTEEVVRIAHRASEAGSTAASGAVPAVEVTPSAADAHASHHPILGVIVEFPDRVLHAKGSMTKTTTAPLSAKTRNDRRDAFAALANAPADRAASDASLRALLPSLEAASAPGARSEEASASALHPTTLWHILEDVAFRGDPAVTRSRERVLELHAPTLTSSWQDPILRIDHYRTRSGREFMVASGAEGVRLAQPCRVLRSHGNDRLGDCALVVGLPRTWRPGVALTADAVREIELLRAGLRVARWNPSEGFVCGREVWQREVLGGHELLDAVPPHLPVEDVDGRLLAIHFEHGVLRTVRSNTASAIDAFRAEAASLVRTPGDLLTILAHVTRTIPDHASPTLQERLLAMANPSSPTFCGGALVVDTKSRLELGQDILSHADRRAVLLDLPQHDAILWAESVGRRHTVSMVRLDDSPKFAGPDLEAALAASIAACDPSAIVDPAMLPIRRRCGPRALPTLDHIDVQCLVDAVAMRRFEHLSHDLDRGCLSAAIESLSGELVRATTEPPLSLSLLLGELRIRNGEALGALALLEHVRTRAGTSNTKYTVDRLRLVAALSVGDRTRVLRALDDLATSLAAATDSGPAIDREHANVFALLASSGFGREGADFVGNHTLPRLERALTTEPDRAIEPMVLLIANAAPFAGDDERLSNCLARIAAAGSKHSDELRAIVEFGALRTALGDDRFLERRLGRIEAVAHVPLDVDETWRRLEGRTSQWVAWLDLHLRRSEVDLPVAARLVRELRQSAANSSDPSRWTTTERHRLTRWSSALDAARADDPELCARALEDLLHAGDRDETEDALARVLVKVAPTHAAAVASEWCTVSGDPFAALRLAWHPSVLPTEDLAVTLARLTAAKAGEGEQRRIANEIAAIEKAVARLAVASPPKAR